MVKTTPSVVTAVGVCLALSAAARAADGIDADRYMSTDALRPGMKGFGRTVLSGTEIVTFQVEVISVMRNAFAPKQDVILIRCAGAGLEHSGIIGGMSGSPVYITDAEGRNPRMIGAVAYGWTFNKDPICGVQPIHQMLAVRGVSQTQPTTSRPASSASARPRRPARAPASARFDAVTASGPDMECVAAAGPDPASAGLRPLTTPLMVSGASPRAMAFLREQLEGSGFEPVPSGDAAAAREPGRVKLEPGSALCVPMMRGDSNMNALGTCTEVLGDRVLGFGHPFFGDGPVELPLATGTVYTVIPSVMRSIKLGAALDVVGTLLADENTAVFGRIGPVPQLIPCDVTVREPDRTRTYHYECAQHHFFTPLLLGMTVMDSVEAHSALPREHTLRYRVEAVFKDLGTFRSENITSQDGEMPIASDVLAAVRALMENAFGRSKVDRVAIEIAVEPVARTAQLERAELARDRVKPGETLEVRVWWRPYRAPVIDKTYTLKVPDDLAEGTYELTVGGAADHVRMLRSEKPHLFRVESMKGILDVLNYLAQFQDDHVFLRLGLPTGGMSLGKDILPELPSYRQRILADVKRSDVGRYTDALVAEHPAPFVVSGSRSFQIRVDKRADQ